jgi:hypothetical protein
MHSRYRPAASTLAGQDLRNKAALSNQALEEIVDFSVFQIH